MMYDEEVEGILPSNPQTTTTDHFFGMRKTWAGLQKVEWAFVAVSIINILVTLGMTIYRLVNVLETDSPDFTLTILIIINSVFCALYVVHGVLREKEFEIYIFIGAILFIVTYCVLEYSINYDQRTHVKLARLVIACLLAPVNILLAIGVAREFGWLEFKIMGASEALQIMYREASRFTSLLMFDLQVMINFVLLVLKNGIEVNELEKITLSVGIPISLVWSFLGYISLRQELRGGMVIFGIIGLGVPAYTGFAIYKIYEAFTTDDTDEKLVGDNLVLVYGAMAAAALALIVRGMVLIETWRVFRNFGRGLKERAFEVEVNERTSLLAVPRRR